MDDTATKRFPAARLRSDMTDPVLPVAELREIETELTGRTSYLITTAWPMASLILLNNLVFVGQLKWMALLPQDYADERISWLHVDPEYRRRGFATRMLELAAQESHARGWIAPEQIFTR
jgi:ribosomal protein S18 acetylase RimI-like enzyme